MPPIARAFILCTAGVLLQALICLRLIPALFDISDGQVTLMTTVCVIYAGAYGFMTGILSVYAFTFRSLWAFFLDVTWSLINTMVGTVWLIYCMICAPMRTPPGSWQTPTEQTQRYGMMYVKGVVLGPADATTLGNVMGAKNFLLHETIHMQQARILGIMYWPTYLFGFGFAFLVRLIQIPVWKIFNRFSPGDGDMENIHDDAYRRTSMEDWAYQATLEPDDIAWGLWVVWFFVGLACAATVGIILSPVPFFGALPRLIGLDIVPWWLGIILHFTYAVIRSFLPGSAAKHNDAAPPTMTASSGSIGEEQWA